MKPWYSRHSVLTTFVLPLLAVVAIGIAYKALA
jgi:hypothetical protein